MLLRRVYLRQPLSLCGEYIVQLSAMGSCFKFGFRKKNQYDFQSPYSQSSEQGTYRNSVVHVHGYQDIEQTNNSNVTVKSIENKDAINGTPQSVATNMNHEPNNSLDRAPVVKDIGVKETEVVDRQISQTDSEKSDHSEHRDPTPEPVHEPEPELVHTETVHSEPHHSEPESESEPEVEQEIVQAEEEKRVESTPPPEYSTVKKEAEEQEEFTYNMVQINESAQFGGAANYANEVPEVQVSTVHVGDTESEGEEDEAQYDYNDVSLHKKSDVETESETLEDYHVEVSSSHSPVIEENDNAANEEEEGRRSVEVNMPAELDQIELKSEGITTQQDNGNGSVVHINTPIELVY